MLQLLSRPLSLWSHPTQTHILIFITWRPTARCDALIHTYDQQKSASGVRGRTAFPTDLNVVNLPAAEKELHSRLSENWNNVYMRYPPE